jgi:hypothetical protein
VNPESQQTLVPAAAAIAVLVNPDYPDAEAQINEVQGAARALGLQALILKASSERDFDTAFSTVIEQRAGALLEHVVFYWNRDSQRGRFLIQTPCWGTGASMDDATLFGRHPRTRFGAG